jgi:hypothetical protein
VTKLTPNLELEKLAKLSRHGHMMRIVIDWMALQPIGGEALEPYGKTPKRLRKGDAKQCCP